MTDLFFSIACLYILVAIGFIWKKYIAPGLQARDLSLLMMYCLAPGLVFWGFSSAPLTFAVLEVSLYYAAVCCISLATLLIASYFLKLGPKKRAILTMNNVLLNTGNLGIPIGLAFIGPASLPFTTATNMVAVIFSYILGVYFYSRGSFSMHQSLINIIKLPVLWLGALAITLNLLGVSFSDNFLNFLEITGHTAVGLQLIVLGVFLATYLSPVKDKKLFSITLSAKYILLPLLAFVTIKIFDIQGIVAQILMLQSLMPAAVNNLNLAAMYHCRPEEVTPIVFWSSALGLVFIPVGLWLLL